MTPAKPVLCAGQHCEERKNCTRYRMRYAKAPYASFDIDRQRFGDCPAKLLSGRKA